MKNLQETSISFFNYLNNTSVTSLETSKNTELFFLSMFNNIDKRFSFEFNDKKECLSFMFEDVIVDNIYLRYSFGDNKQSRQDLTLFFLKIINLDKEDIINKIHNSKLKEEFKDLINFKPNKKRSAL
jgi:hypothetical protein